MPRHHIINNNRIRIITDIPKSVVHQVIQFCENPNATIQYLLNMEKYK